jgi:hypothetical protein
MTTCNKVPSLLPDLRTSSFSRGRSSQAMLLVMLYLVSPFPLAEYIFGTIIE